MFIIVASQSDNPECAMNPPSGDAGKNGARAVAIGRRKKSGLDRRKRAALSGPLLIIASVIAASIFTLIWLRAKA